MRCHRALIIVIVVIITAIRPLAVERLRLAEMRAEAAERAQRELIITAEHKLQDACRALEQAKSRIEAQEDKLTAIEFRAQAAEAEAREAKQALALRRVGFRTFLRRQDDHHDPHGAWHLARLAHSG